MRLAPVQPFAAEQYCSTTICLDGHRCLTLPCTPYHPGGESRPEVGTDRRRPRSPRRPDERPVARPAFSTETLPIPVAVHFIWRDARKTRHLLFSPRKPIRRRRRLAQWCVRYCTRWHIYIFMQKCTFYHIWSNTLYMQASICYNCHHVNLKSSPARVRGWCFS